MKLVKSLALGSAAAFVMTAGAAKAADLPGAEPVEYVKVCDIKGSTGFFYIPGTETCLQIGGFARLEMTEVFKRNADDDFANRTGYRTRARIWFDARTSTEYGDVRTFIRLQFQRETGNAAGITAGAKVAGTGASATNRDVTADDAFFDQAFVQFAGLTAGVTDSFWDFKPYPTFQNPFISDRTVPLIGYTAKVGDFSASVSLEDKTARYRTDALGARNAGQEIPDIVANLRVKQGWGEAQISGVVHRIDPQGFPFVGAQGIDTPGPAGVFGGDDKWGWGVQAGVKLNLPTANTADNKGDFIWGQAGYNNGAGLSYSGIGDANVGSGTTENIVNYNPAVDWLVNNGDTLRTKAFNANLGVLHYWSPQWRSALQGTYINVDYKRAKTDWSAYTITGNLIWTPIKKLDIGGELVYVNAKMSKSIGFPRVDKLNRGDDDAWVGRLRVQRDF